MGHARFNNKQGRDLVIKYKPQDLKVVREVWQDIFREQFKQDSRMPLDELIKIEIGKGNYIQASKFIRSNIGSDFQVYYIRNSGHPIEIPKRLEPLCVLVINQSGYNFSVEGNKVYVSPVAR